MRSPFKILGLRLAWQFTNTFLLLASLVVLFVLVQFPGVQTFIAGVGRWGVLGAFVTGIFFVSTFTVVPATVVLVSLAHTLNPVTLALAASAGAMLGDYVLFRFVRDRVLDEWVPLLKQLADTEFGRVFSSPFFVWLAPVIGALIIASPLPDELGVSLLGAVRLGSLKMLALTFALNASGIFIVVFLTRMVMHVGV